MPLRLKSNPAFTLAELLIALAILGVIATFTIPKIVSAQTNTKYNAIAKESLSTVSAAYQVYQQNNTASSSTTLGVLTQYMNYVKTDTSTPIDDTPTGGGSPSCSTSFVCVRFHNGSLLWMDVSESFGGTNSTNGIFFILDPDGSANGSPSVAGILTPGGRIVTTGTCTGSYVSSTGTFTCASGNNPTWFSW